VCQFCDVADPGLGADSAARLAEFAIEPGLRRAATVNVEAAHGAAAAAASAMPEGAGIASDLFRA
jgi:hypothetical protein